MRILYIYDGDWPQGATRVSKQTRSLAAAGHQIFMLSRNRLRAPRVEAHPWMTLLRLPTFPGRALNAALNFPAFFNPVWIWSMLMAGRTHRVDAVVVVDLPLAPAALLVGRMLGLPVHMDMGEVYPPFLEGLHATGKMGRLDGFVRNPAAAEALERAVVPRMTTVTVVSDESMQRCIDQLGVPADRIIIARNTPIPPEGGFPDPGEEPGGQPTILFVGIMIHDRGLVEAVRAMPTVLAALPTALLLLVGDGPERPFIEEEVRALELQDAVEFAGWRQPDELAAYYRASHVGLLPFLDVGQISITLANKLFDYMSAGLPVVATDVPPMRRIVDRVGCGELVAAGNPESIAEGILRVLQDPERHARGRRGWVAVNEEFNWNEDGGRFVAGIAGRTPAGSGSPRPG